MSDYRVYVRLPKTAPHRGKTLKHAINIVLNEAYNGAPSFLRFAIRHNGKTVFVGNAIEASNFLIKKGEKNE